MKNDPSDYKDTLFLPQTKFPMRANLPNREPTWLKRWEEMNVYFELRKKSKKKKKFILHDGPPYANGHLHIGHALNKILKDFIVRSHQMLGFDSPYVPGWDCHGLPIEWKIEEEYKKKGKNKNEVSVIELRKECRSFAEKWVKIQEKEFKRLGIIGDWENPYLTMDYNSEAVITEEFLKFLMNDTLYQGSKPVMWSPVEKTALAEAEIEYFEHESFTIWVKFCFLNGKYKDSSLVIWTTTPWTIPSNKAVAYKDNISYGLYEIEETEDECWVKKYEKLIISQNLVEDVMRKGRVKKFSKICDIDTTDFKNSMLSHPFRNISDGKGFWDYNVPLIEGDHVTDDVGTGFVHTAPSHGTEDYEIFVKYGWSNQLTHNINEDSSFSENVPLFGNLKVFDKKGKNGKANEEVIKKLIDCKSLLARGKLKHSYPHSWRSKAPVIYRNTPQWFVSVDKKIKDNMRELGDTIRERALNSIDSLVKWTPSSGRNRLHKMISDRPDWVLSRQRAWGVPLTCFIKKNAEPSDPNFILKDKLVNDRIVESFKQEGADAWFKSDAKKRFLENLYNEDDYFQIFDILDVWFDSGSTHAFVLRDREDGKWPADLYLEGTDQHRGWFHSSMLQSCGTRGKAPYTGVLTHGFALDENGMKMSKSAGNTVSPDQVIKQYGADILRLWVAQTDYSSDLRIGPEILKGVADSYRRLRNTFRFLIGNLNNFKADKEEINFEKLPELERWILHRLREVDELVKKDYEEYSFQTLYQNIFNFCTTDLSAFYFDIRKDVLYCEHEESTLRKNVLLVLDLIFHRLITWLAPILVFTTEEVWLERFPGQNNSVHLLEIPETPKAWLNSSINSKWLNIKKVRKVVTGAIEIERKNKEIGSSLEAFPSVFIKDKNLYNDIISIDFSEICITSDINIIFGECSDKCFKIDEVENVFVIVKKASGTKCERCWKMTNKIKIQSNLSKLCLRCHDVINLMT